MSEYKEIHGQKLQVVSSDPSNPFEGQVWYNSTTNSLKVRTLSSVASWASGGNLNTARYDGASAGTLTAGLIFGGYAVDTPGTSPTYSKGTEEYDGSSWTSGGNLASQRIQVAGSGTQTAAWAAGGYPWYPGNEPLQGESEEYNGTSWTSGGNLVGGRRLAKGAGTLTAGLMVGGYNSSDPTVPAYNRTLLSSEEYNGTSWTSGGNLSQPRRAHGLLGIQTAAITSGGGSPPTTYWSSTTEEYNGTSWTSSDTLAADARYHTSDGTVTAGFLVGGSGPTGSPGGGDGSYQVQMYDGTTWTTSPSISNNRYTHGGSKGGTQTASWIAGGTNTPQNFDGLTSTEELSQTISSNTIS